MASEKTYSLDLSGGVTCDAEKFSLAISDMENLVKPIGGAAQGLRVRGGQTYFDNVASVIGPGDTGIIAIAAALNPADGYPAGSVATILVNSGTGAVVDMQIGISKYGISSDETDLEPTLIPMGACRTSAGMGAYPAPYVVFVLMSYDTVIGDFVYAYCWMANDHNTFSFYPHVTNEGKVIDYAHGGYTPDQAAVNVFNYNRIKLVAPATASSSFVATTETLTVPPSGYYPYVKYGAEWVSRGRVFYSIFVKIAAASTAQFQIWRVNVETGASMGFVSVTLPMLSGSTSATLSATYPVSRPDANGDVIVIYRTNNARRGIAKVNPATGAVTASLDITATVPDWFDAYTTVTPMSTGTYLLQTDSTRWFRFNAGLTTITEILVGTGTGIGFIPLPLFGGDSDTYYCAKLMSTVGATSLFRLHTITAVSTAPVATTGATDLPAIVSSFAVGPVDLQSRTMVVEDGHCRLSADTAMWGRWGLVTLSTGAHTLVPRADRLGMHTADPGVLGGASYLYGTGGVGPDPARWLLSREGFRESV